MNTTAIIKRRVSQMAAKDMIVHFNQGAKMETPFEYNKQSLKKVELFKSVINAAQDMIQEKLSANRTRVIILNKLDEVSDLINISIKEDQIAKASKAYADNGSKP